ncbi:hypothetical protein GCM10010112_17130 [Actinoplanes lobatus]|uniref:ABC-type molybdate transport system substrate-binding protein n=1 Tax=Actinoplanes lobatus TaxID=113568 RepID=A0A7W7H9C4_9ACTN|nr:hypothetical protein [Actinoplanes lobatus]MBB4746324.1 ABC-type molybdate transport system substrate-binding protein [Actinoplanes lobatus]GGN60638.1 hypothetical protein GCM10010112_17130 [Actinoplanes lobatus]GIE41214.1 hypothetical protein Alo02nite_41120 [Actinoplanes lobatus]
MRGLIVVLIAGVLATGGCAGVGSGSNDGSGPAGPVDPGSGPQAGLVELRVAVAESLAKDFPAVEQGFEAQNPSIEVLVAPGEDESAEVVVTDEPVAVPGGEVETIGPLRVVLVDGAGAEAAAFVEFLRDGEGRRILIDSGVLRP